MKTTAPKSKSPARAPGSPQPAGLGPVRRAPSRSSGEEVRAVLGRPSVQGKIALGKSGDAHEAEADRVADHVLGMSAPLSAAPPPSRAQTGVQRKESPQAPPPPDHLPTDDGLVHRISTTGGGAPLSAESRAFFEPRFGYDFSRVRVHEGTQASSDARRLGARAFTYGNQIWLGRGESAQDKKLMAHELTHVVQQSGAVHRLPMPIAAAEPQVQRAEAEDQGGFLGGIRKEISGWARQQRGYGLVTVILGKDPVTQVKVERSIENFLKAFKDLVPEETKKAIEGALTAGAQALRQAYDWVMAELTKRGLTLENIKSKVDTVWGKLSVWHPIDSLNAVKEEFSGLAAAAWDFAKEAGIKILQVIFEALMKAGGTWATRILNLFKKAKSAISFIALHPVEFFKRLFGALAAGVHLFEKRFLDHLKSSLISWVKGQLAEVGVHLPQKLSLASIATLGMEILGITLEKIKAAVAKKLGPERVAQVEAAIQFVIDIKNGGWAAVWEKIKGFFGGLKDQVIGAIQGWVQKTIIGAAIEKIAKLLVPAAALVEAIETGYHVLETIFQKAELIFGMIERFFDSLADIIAGQTGPAALALDTIFAGGLTLVINFLANYLGLGKLGKFVKEQILKLQTLVDTGIEKLVGFLIDKLGSAIGSVKGALGRLFDTPVKMGTADHELFVKEDPSGKQVVMMASANPESVLDRVARVVPKLEEYKKKASPAEAAKVTERITQLQDYAKRVTEIQKVAKPDDKQKKETEAALKAMSGLMEKDAQKYGITELDQEPGDGEYKLYDVDKNEARSETMIKRPTEYSGPLDRATVLAEAKDPKYVQEVTDWGRIYDGGSNMKMRPTRAVGYVTPSSKERVVPQNLSHRMPDDDRGHVVAREMGGDNHDTDFNNFIPMHKDVNRAPGPWRQMEIAVVKLLNAGFAVMVDIKIKYAGPKDTRRPSGFVFNARVEDKTHKPVKDPALIAEQVKKKSDGTIPVTVSNGEIKSEMGNP